MIDRDAVVAALETQAVLDHYHAEGRWFGRWFRSRWCPYTTHGSPAFGASRDGRWHCHACGEDAGGDLLHLIAAAEGLDVRRDFGEILAVAADIAGVVDEDAFGGPAPRPRPEPRPDTSAADREDRIARARLRARWLWLRLDPRLVAEDQTRPGPHYLAGRGLDPVALYRMGEPIRFSPASILDAECRGRDELQLTRRMFSVPSVCLPVRSIVDDEMIDVRARRIRPLEGAPKIVGMPGGVTWPDGSLAGCYGRPASLGIGDVIVVEGWADYLAARLAWPDDDVLGAVDAGQLRVVVGYAAAHVADTGGRLIIVGQDDGETGAAARSLDRASAAAMRSGVAPSEIVVLDCKVDLGTKDLADLLVHPGGIDEARDALAARCGGA